MERAGPFPRGSDDAVASVAAVSTSQARVLVVDNYDSFVYNLVQYLGELGPSRWCTATTS